jgi:hypothetical protein
LRRCRQNRCDLAAGGGPECNEPWKQVFSVILSADDGATSATASAEAIRMVERVRESPSGVVIWRDLARNLLDVAILDRLDGVQLAV